MSEAARADWLARAVNGLLKGHHPPEAPAGENQTEIDSLLQAARGRLELSMLAANLGRQYQGAVWQELVRRLHSSQARAEDVSALQGLADLRSEVSDIASTLAEKRRSTVWQKISERVAHKTPEKGIASFLRRLRRTGDENRSDRAPQLSSRSTHQPVPPIAEGALATAKQRVWAKVAANAAIAERVAAGEQRAQGGSVFPTRVALAAASAALILAAVGPLPVTGLADHPATRAIDSLSEQLVAEESPPRATTLPPPEIVLGRPMSPDEASVLMDIPVSEAALPDGFRMISSSYYPDMGNGGAFIAVYESAAGDIVVQQEAAPNDELTADGGSISQIELPDGTLAAFTEGAWESKAGEFRWTRGSDRSLLFERDGVRTIISVRGQALDLESLVAIASSMR